MKYKALLDGLEAVEIRLSNALKVETFRLDSDYVKKKYLKILKQISLKNNLFDSFSDLGISVDASAFYPSLEPYYNQGNIPFLRVADVDVHIDYDGCVKIPNEVINDTSFNTLKVIDKGDIVVTKGGSIARVGLIEQRTAVTRDLIFLNSSSLSDVEYKFLYLYLLSSTSYNLLVRSSSMTAQPHLTVKLVRSLPIFNPDILFKNKIVDIYDFSKEKLEESKFLYKQAESILLAELNILNFKPSEINISIKSLNESFGNSGRLDSEYYQEKYDELERKISETHELGKLKDFLILNQRGSQPNYSEHGLPVINSKYVKEGEIVLSDNRFAQLPDKEDSLFIKKGDVLINGTGVGTIGRSAPYLHEKNAIPDNHVTILRTKHLNPIFLSVYLNSIAGKYQVDKYFKGSSGQIELYPKDIDDFYIPLIKEKVQKTISDKIKSSFKLKAESKRLLDLATKSVEIAINKNEKEAIKLIEARGV